MSRGSGVGGFRGMVVVEEEAEGRGWAGWMMREVRGGGSGMVKRSGIE